MPLEAGAGAVGAEDEIDADGVVGGGGDLVGDGVVADRAGGVDAAAPAGVGGVEAFGDALGEDGHGEAARGRVVTELGGDLGDDREALGRMGHGGAGQGEGAGRTASSACCFSAELRKALRKSSAI